MTTQEQDLSALQLPDDTGLTKSQKVAVVAAWSIVKQDMITHGRNIFIRFFEEHPKYVSYFDFSQDTEAIELKDNKSLHAHALNVMQLIGSLIDYGLENPVMFKCTLAKMARNHKMRGIIKKDMEIVCEVIKDYCLEALASHRSKTLDEGLVAFLESVVNSFET
ncbi:myoglobin-like [Sabethes cyaneus]|uniref:myoglobin-like n=1 Tax=Sabethes cyaneus TaxID=53552 RepID=UPI00237D6307|nr:myoglobin-like [Sabethes cyaneus]